MWSGVNEEVERSKMNDNAADFAFKNKYILPTNYYCLDNRIAQKTVILGINSKGLDFVYYPNANDISNSIQQALFGEIKFKV